MTNCRSSICSGMVADVNVPYKETCCSSTVAMLEQEVEEKVVGLVISFSVHGMDCASCATTLESNLLNLSGVNSAKVGFLSKIAEVSYEPSVVDVSSIRFAIEKAGYRAVPYSRQEAGQVAFQVMGNMDVAKLAALACDGVVEVSISPIYDSVLVCKFDPDVVGPRQILNALGSAAVLFKAESFSEQGAIQRKDLLWTLCKFIIAACVTTPLVLIAFFLPLDSAISMNLSRHVQGNVSVSMIISFVLCTIVLGVLGPAMYVSAYRALRYQRTFNMSFLVMLSSTIAYVYSCAIFFALFAAPVGLSAEVFFETPAILLTLVTLGTLLEKLAMRKSAKYVTNLKQLKEASAVLMDSDGTEIVLDADLIGRGDRVKIIPGSRIPVDGRVVEGCSGVDESLVTGESVPVRKEVNSSVVAGTVNQEGFLTVVATKMASESTLVKMCEFVDAALAEKMPVERMADRVSHYFVPIALVLGILTFFVWFALAYTGTVVTSTFSVLFALRFAVAVLVVSCPCAIALAAPTVVMVATGLAAKHGVMVKGATVWEGARKLDTIVFDKTGSLTLGKLDVVQFDIIDSSLPRQDVLRYLAAAESKSEHLIAKALTRYASVELGSSIGVTDTTVEAFVTLPGMGVECVVDSVEKLLVGNLSLMTKKNVAVPKRVIDDAKECSGRGCVTLYLALNGELKAWAALSDVLRTESRSIVAHLVKQGLDVWIVSGDAAPAVQALAFDLGIPLDNVRAGVLPEGKAEQVKELQKEGRLVAMVGDGCNDAAALAIANVGIAIGGGTDMATSAAGVILMRDHLEGVLVVTELAKSVSRRIVINLIWAFAYNCIAIPLAMGFFWPLGVFIPPAIAGASELASAVPVIILSLLLGLWHLRYDVLTDTFTGVDVERFIASK
jgi:Cu+-exporting ATPase